MINHSRHKKILHLLSQHHEVSVDEFVEWLPSSSATVRRDLLWLGSHNLLTRKHGGAAYRPQLANQSRICGEALESNRSSRAAQKRAIARHASSLCEDGERIIINGGTTTFMMAEFIADKPLNILTNSFPLARRLLGSKHAEVTITGGSVYREHDVILSPFDGNPQHYAATKMFLGVFGIGEQGLIEVAPLVIHAEQGLINLCEDLVVLADSTKFTRKTGLILCELAQVGCVITDTGAPEFAVQMLERAGVKVITVEPEIELSVCH
jgi:DeoR family ulaG and ulaABCDEF operon transcriptional repressor